MGMGSVAACSLPATPGNARPQGPHADGILHAQDELTQARTSQMPSAALGIGPLGAISRADVRIPSARLGVPDPAYVCGSRRLLHLPGGHYASDKIPRVILHIGTPNPWKTHVTWGDQSRPVPAGLAPPDSREQRPRPPAIPLSGSPALGTLMSVDICRNPRA